MVFQVLKKYNIDTSHMSLLKVDNEVIRKKILNDKRLNIRYTHQAGRVLPDAPASAMLDGDSMVQQGNSDGTGTGGKRFARIDYVKITILGFGLTALWSSLNSIVLPIQLLEFVLELIEHLLVFICPHDSSA